MNKSPHLPRPDSCLLDSPEIDQAPPESILLSWRARVRWLTNGQVWRNVVAALGIACVLWTALLLSITKSGMALVAGGSPFAGFMLLFVLLAVVIDLFGRFHVRFVLTSQGVRSFSEREVRAAADAVFPVGMARGKPGTVAAGRAVRCEQNIFIPYTHVAKIRLGEARHSILVEGSLIEKPIRLDCTAENYDQVEAILREHCPSFIFV